MTMKVILFFLCYPLVAVEQVALAFRLRPTPPTPPAFKNTRLAPHPPREGGTVAVAKPNVRTTKGGSIDSSLFSQAAAHSDRSIDDAERALEQAGKVLASTAAGRIRLPSPPNVPPPNFVPTPPRTPPTRAQARRAFEEAIKAFRQQSTDVRGRINGLTSKTRSSSASAVETVDLFGEGDGAAVNGSGRRTRSRRTRRTPTPPAPSSDIIGRSSASERREAFAAAVGGAALGAVAGVALDVALGQDLLVDFDAYVTTSATLGVALAAASAYAATYPAEYDDDSTSSVARGALARGSRALGRAILGVVRSGVGRIGNAIESRVEDTVDEVRRTPDKIRAAATDASVRAVERIRDTPRMFAEGTKNAFQGGVNRIRGIPGQIGRAIEEKVDETVVEMKRTPEKIKAAATDASSAAVKKLQSTPVELAGSVSKMIPEATKSPRPPTVLPSVTSKRDVKQQESSSPPTIIKPSPPKARAPLPQTKPAAPPKVVKTPFFLSRRTREEEATIEARKLVERRKEEAARAVNKAEPGATISLFGFLFPKQTASPTTAVPKRRGSVTSGAPGGVPTISNWRLNAAGAIVGFVSDSTKFEDGESITTSRIKGEAIGGTVVETVTGSRYFLEPPATFKGPTSSLNNQKKAGKTIAAELKR